MRPESDHVAASPSPLFGRGRGGDRYDTAMPADAPTLDVKLQPGPVTYAPWDPFPSDAGAECVFLGRTRADAHPDHGPLRELSYDAYADMAERVMRELAHQAADEHGCLAVRLHHAIGTVPAGAASVLVQTVAGHRAEAFAACRFLIDTLKVRVPVWKRERWSDGETWAPGAPVITEGDER